MADSPSVGDSIASWVVFGFCLLLASTSTYLARLVFSITKVLQQRGRHFLFMSHLKEKMQVPLAYGLSALFIYIAFNLVFPWSQTIFWLRGRRTMIV